MDASSTIREMCDEFGVTARTLRFYEAKELLFPIRDGQNDFSQNVIELVLN
jgi:DNA-binding transcriptional MerR regulator